MEELEKKAKAYDDVKEKIALRFGSNVAEEIFSEYEMNEDEKVRKAIIKILNEIVVDFNYKEYLNISYNIKDMVAWLEKQGEQNLPSVNERAWLYLVSDVLTWKDGIGQYLDNPRVQKLAKDLSSEYAQKLYNYPISSNSLNIGNNNQEPADKVEPKFNVGDWVINTVGDTNQVVKVWDDGYTLDNDTFLSNSWATRHYHLWTIRDAKDGDVLSYVTDEEDLWIMIYMSLYEPYEGHVHYHALLVNDNFTGKGTCCISINDLKPATKEQRDLLFQKMKEAGYEWDAEKKEPKKIEKDLTEFESNMIQWKGNNLNEVIAFTGKDKNFDKWFKSFEEYEEYVHEHNDIFKLFNEDGSHYEVPVGAWIVKTPDGRNVASKAIFKNKPADWSVDDRTKVQRICGYLNEIKKYYADINEVRECIDWLKSIKERIGWKPSEEQMEALTLAIHDVHEMWYKKHLLSLKQQLKQV